MVSALEIGEWVQHKVKWLHLLSEGAKAEKVNQALNQISILLFLYSYLPSTTYQFS